MIRVCDAIMGSGKTSAAINYMNSHPEQHFIYVAPYLDEAARIVKCCPELDFKEPKLATSLSALGKVNHTAGLIKCGSNIATTHSAFLMYTKDMLEDIRHYGYTLIIDESVDVLQLVDVRKEDIDIAVREGYISVESDRYKSTGKEYNGSLFKGVLRMLQSRDIMRVKSSTGESLLYWIIPEDLFRSFRDVYVLTYLFRGQTLYYFLRLHNIDYKMIGTMKTESGEFQFCDGRGVQPEYVKHLDSMIHILDNKRMNAIGESRCALSVSWYSSHTDGVEQLRKNLLNYYHNIHKECAGDDRLWSAFNVRKKRLQGPGYTKAFLPFNARATNEYRDRDCLAYLANVFTNVGEKMFFRERGIVVSDELYALSNMVQWIWRSAIRDGKEIHIYIPSRRMRTILQNWIKATMEGGAIECQNVGETAGNVYSDTVA